MNVSNNDVKLLLFKSIQASDSLDSCIQEILSSLYLPFDATATSVLSQVFDVVEKHYSGDGLHYLLDFLIPVKHILQCLQQEACVQFHGLIFRHEGWPLCIHEKIIVQLASFDWKSLKPGDFYLQVVPYLKKTPQIVLKFLAKDKHNIEELVIPEVQYMSVFTEEWLEAINQKHSGTSLENCLLSTNDNIFCVPWKNIVTPEFIHLPKILENVSTLRVNEDMPLSNPTPLKKHRNCTPAVSKPDNLGLWMSNFDRSEFTAENFLTSVEQCASKILMEGETFDSDLEGEYVDLEELPPLLLTQQSSAAAPSVELNYLNQCVGKVETSTEITNLVDAYRDKPHDCIHSDCSNPLRSAGSELLNSLHLVTERGECCEVVDHLCSAEIDRKGKCDATSLTTQTVLYCMEDSPSSIKTHYNTAEICEPFALKQVDDCNTQYNLSKNKSKLTVAGKESTVDFNFRSNFRNEVNILENTDCPHVHSEDICSVVECMSVPETVGIQEPFKASSLHCAEVSNPLMSADLFYIDKLQQASNSALLENPNCNLQQQPKGDIALDSTCICSAFQVQSADANPVKACLIDEQVPSNGTMCSMEQNCEIPFHQKDSTLKDVTGDRKDQYSFDVFDKDITREEDACLDKDQKANQVFKLGEIDSTLLAGTDRPFTADECCAGDTCLKPTSGNASFGNEHSSDDIDEKVAAQTKPLNGISSLEGTSSHHVQLTEQLQMEHANVLWQHENTCDKEQNINEKKEDVLVSQLLPGEENVPMQHRLLLTSPSTARLSLTTTSKAQEVNLDILRSGVACLPGTRDRSGRAVVIISTKNPIWLSPHCNCCDLVHLLLYFSSIISIEIRALGLTILVDARRCLPVPELFKSFNALQDAVPNCIHVVLVLADKDFSFRVAKPTSVQFILLTSMKSLHKHIEGAQLPTDFDGAFSYNHSNWLHFQMRLEQFIYACHEAHALIQNAVMRMEMSKLPETAEEAIVSLEQCKQLMKNVLEDDRLVRLQLQGGAMLARLKKEDFCIIRTDTYRHSVKTVTILYNQVDEGLHRLVMLSNEHMQKLKFMIEFKKCEDSLREVSSWIEDVGSKHLTRNEQDDSLEQLLCTHKSFMDFSMVANIYCRKGQELLKNLQPWEDVHILEIKGYKDILKKHKEQLREFLLKIEDCKMNLNKTVALHEFFDEAYKWASEGMCHLASVNMEHCNSAERCDTVIKCLEEYRHHHPEIPVSKFKEMEKLAASLNNERAINQWKFAWSKCQEAKLVYEKKLEAVLRIKRALQINRKQLDEDHEMSCSKSIILTNRQYSEEADHNVLSERNNIVFSSFSGLSQLTQEKLVMNSPGECHDDEYNGNEAILSDATARQILTPTTNRGTHRLITSHSLDEHYKEFLGDIPSFSSPYFSTPGPNRHMKRTVRKARSFDIPSSECMRYGSCQRTLSEPTRRGNTGVFIKGLEVSSSVVADRTYSSRQQEVQSWPVSQMDGCVTPSLLARNKCSKLRHIIDEMVTTEKEYVKSLRYVIDNYYPEMERFDLPQDLRGKRNIIFGNLEKLYNFHSQYFLKELESCCNHPLRVSHGFLRHTDQFGMYALYIKNKPKSDALLSNHGNTFFKCKQLQLGDKMNLASYLLKPVQRMSKYALLLKDLIKECNESQEQELAYLRAAAEIVKFQLRHGNDLLAMDAIRDCDVNLKEQGQLIRQDEFIVYLGRRKYHRHIFLFEDLILFSKLKKIDGGRDIYTYKQSFKTSDIGLTENAGESGLRFEVWFRRRKSNDTYILQASSPEVKLSWINDIARILWQQASRNKEVRMQEMVSMGVGNKPYMDIKPSDAAINDRAIDYIMKGRGSRTRASIAVSLFDHSDPYKRTQTPVSSSGTSSCSSSSSLLGPLNLHIYRNPPLLHGVLGTVHTFDISTCIEEEDLEHEPNSQPSTTTESSESSHCVSGSGSSGSDSGCVSSILPESLSEEASSPCDTSTSYFPSGSRNVLNSLSPLEEKTTKTNQIVINPSTVL
ncbi:puratrophin-1 [Protopterus annectens]|uniref:puratrophin-1 n=1 Tax=Protopterus annectens TaxID=7888 RepID=UPI001CFBAC43|nr:puratrophin-1 [Protopterus annectens]